MMKRLLCGASALLILVMALSMSISVSAESVYQTAPTLVPPTLVPTVDDGSSDALPSESTVARVLRDGKVRVGLLYNNPPFGELNIRGEVSGFDADLARSMAEAWGVTFEPVQVTRQTAIEFVKNGTVDMLVASQIHRRELDNQVEFSQTYYAGSQSILVRQDDGAASPADMANRKIGVVIGTASEIAVTQWQARTGIAITVQTYLTLDRGFAALLNSEIDGLVDTQVQLTRIQPSPGLAKILPEGISPEPFAVVLRRQDVNWRNLINRTLQHLTQNGRMQEIQGANFPGTKYPVNLIPTWAGLGADAPKPDQFGQDIPYPAQYAIPRIQAAGVVRVAGVVDVPEDAPESDKRLDAVNRTVMDAIAARWGLRVEYIPSSAAHAVDLVANGQADVAIGVPLDWSLTDRVDLTASYLLHGQRLMVEEDSDIETFNELRGKWVGIFASEPGIADQVNALAESVQTPVDIFTIVRDQDAASYVLVENNADVVFGDSLKLIPQLEANAGLLRLTTRGDAPDPWYSRIYVGLATPRNDLDFKLLVDYTLQELARDGTLNGLLTSVMLPQDIPAFDVWPGSSLYLGFQLDQNNILAG
jgi:polar amino acid transport system substrate-binding protein